MRKSAFVKVSGDLYDNRQFLEFIRTLIRNYFVVICVGGGTQINQALQDAGFPLEKHGPLGREAKSLRERQIARDALEDNQAQLQDKLEDLRIPAVVIIPMLDVGSVLCPANGDEMVRAAYLGFDTLFVITTRDRRKKKAKEFADLPKVKVVPVDCPKHVDTFPKRGPDGKID